MRTNGHVNLFNQVVSTSRALTLMFSPMLTPSKPTSFLHSSDFNSRSSPLTTHPHSTFKSSTLPRFMPPSSPRNVFLPTQPSLLTPATSPQKSPSDYQYTSVNLKRKCATSSTPLRQHSLTPLQIFPSPVDLHSSTIFHRLAPRDLNTSAAPEPQLHYQTSSLKKLRISDDSSFGDPGSKDAIQSNIPWGRKQAKLTGKDDSTLR